VKIKIGITPTGGENFVFTKHLRKQVFSLPMTTCKNKKHETPYVSSSGLEPHVVMKTISNDSEEVLPPSLW
jgi:hypothetical protein